MITDNLKFIIGAICGMLIANASTMLYNKVFETETKESLKKNIETLNEQLDSTVKINKNLHEVNNKLEQEYKNQLQVQKEYCEKMMKQTNDYNKITKERNTKIKTVLSADNIKVKGMTEKEAKEISKLGITSLHDTFNLYVNNEGEKK